MAKYEVIKNKLYGVDVAKWVDEGILDLHSDGISISNPEQSCASEVKLSQWTLAN